MKSRYSYRISLLILLLSSYHVYAQLNTFQFQHLTVEDGLSDNSVVCLEQDKPGYMWLGTEDGLNRYDGYHVTIFKHHEKDSSSIPANYIKCLLADSTGFLWVGTTSGLARFDPPSASFIPYRLYHDPNSINSITAFAEDRKGVLWIGTTNGLYFLNAGESVSRKYFEEYSPAFRKQVSSIQIEKWGNIWITSRYNTHSKP